MAVITRNFAPPVSRCVNHLRRSVDSLGVCLFHYGILIMERMDSGKLCLQFYLTEDREIEIAEWREGGELGFFGFAPDGVQDRLVKAYVEVYAALMVR